MKYELRQKRTFKPAAPVSAALPPSQENPVRPSQTSPTQPAQAFCWRCKGSHAPKSCARWKPNTAGFPKPPQQPDAGPYHDPDRQGTLSALTHSGDLGTSISVKPFTLPSEKSPPLQLMVPLNIGPWRGIGLLDSGSSYTLINENVWTGVKGEHDVLQPWTRGFLYLADGEPRQPLGWSEMKLTLQSQSVTLPCVIMPAHSLTFPVFVGLDYIYFSGLQFDITENSYWFKSNKNHTHQFLEDVAGGRVGLPPHLSFFSAVPPVEQVLLPPCPNVLYAAADGAHLDEFGKRPLLH